MFNWFSNFFAYMARLLLPNDGRFGPLVRVAPDSLSAVQGAMLQPQKRSARSGPGHRSIFNDFTGRPSRCYQDRSKYSPAACRANGNR